MLCRKFRQYSENGVGVIRLCHPENTGAYVLPPAYNLSIFWGRAWLVANWRCFWWLSSFFEVPGQAHTHQDGH